MKLIKNYLVGTLYSKNNNDTFDIYKNEITQNLKVKIEESYLFPIEYIDLSKFEKYDVIGGENTIIWEVGENKNV